MSPNWAAAMAFYVAGVRFLMEKNAVRVWFVTDLIDKDTVEEIIDTFADLLVDNGYDLLIEVTYDVAIATFNITSKSTTFFRGSSVLGKKYIVLKALSKKLTKD